MVADRRPVECLELLLDPAQLLPAERDFLAHALKFDADGRLIEGGLEQGLAGAQGRLAALLFGLVKLFLLAADQFDDLLVLDPEREVR